MRDTPPPTQHLGAPPCLYVICHSHTKQVERLANWIKGGLVGGLSSGFKTPIDFEEPIAVGANEWKIITEYDE